MLTRFKSLEVTPLYQAASNGDNKKLEELLQITGVNINQLCFQKTALEASIITRKESTALLLINSGAQLRFEDGSNALCAASYYGLKEVVQAAIGQSLNINTNVNGRYPILYAVKGGHADMVDHLLQQGVKISRFEVHPLHESEFATGNFKNPFSAAWHQQRYDIFLLLLDATLTHKCRKRGWEFNELPSQLNESDPRERLAERLAIWLKSRYWEPVDEDAEYAGPNMVIWRTLTLVFGMGRFLRGDSVLVRLLIEKNVPFPGSIPAFLKRHWYGLWKDPSGISNSLYLRPTILEITFTTLPLIRESDKEDYWLVRILNALVEDGLPFTFESIEQKLGPQCSLLRKTIPF